MRCKECVYCQGYSNPWCEKDNPNFDVSKEISCRDFEWVLPEKQETKIVQEISIPLTSRLIESDLLEEILTTLETLNHSQIIKLASLNFKDQDRTETYELEELDLDILIGKIKMVLK